VQPGGQREIAHRLVPFVGNPNRSQFPSSRQLGQANRIASVGFYPIAAFS
jgi:hypothetical protein